MKNLKWDILPTPPEDFFAEHPDYSRTLLHLLYHRNIRTSEDIEVFLHPNYADHVYDPYLFKDMEKAVTRLEQAMVNEERITIYGDYDADGVSAAVILASLFNALDYKHYNVYLPHREKDGYGLNKNAVALLADEGTKVLITCDCGISNAPEVDQANALGIDVIITDHHSIPVTIPSAYAIIHPKIENEPYPDKNLAGGGVAFKLMQGVLKKHKQTHDLLPNGESHEAFEKWQLDMCAIASVADMVPLIGEPRTLTKYGLIVLAKSRRIGMQKLFLEAGIMHNDGSLQRDIDANTIGFRIAPRINADHANVAYNLLMEPNGANATDLAFRLEQTNTERRELTDLVTAEAIEQAKKLAHDPIIIVYGPYWSPGITGLVAGKLVQEFGKPAIVIVDNGEKCSASGRSIPGFNMIAALQANPEHFLKFGGHPMACGFSIENKNTIPALKQALFTTFKEMTAGKDLTPNIQIDAEILLTNVNWDLWDELLLLEPYGQQNARPRFLIKNLNIDDLSPLGAEEKHIKLWVRANNTKKQLIGWQVCAGSDPNLCKTLKKGDVIDTVVEVDVNEWNGNRELRLTLVDLRKQ